MDLRTKAYGNAPLHGIEKKKKRNLIYLINPSLADATALYEKRVAGFPTTDVFEFDSTLFSRLRQAFTAGSDENLDSLWASAKPVELDKLSRR